MASPDGLELMRRILLASTLLTMAAAPITPGGSSITDASGNRWDISQSGSIQENGDWVPGGGGTSALTIGDDGTIYGEDAHGRGWFTFSSDVWTNSAPPRGISASVVATLPLAAATPTVSPPITCGGSPAVGTFRTVGGQIMGPDGQPWIGRGINLYDSQMGEANQIIATFPGINFIRVNIHGYQSPGAYQGFVDTMTGHGIVVEFEDHPDGGGGDQNGVQVFTGGKLAAESTWYASMAAAYAGNSYVWWGTYNEPPTQGGSLTAWQVATYNAIRGAGNNSPILIEVSGSRPDSLQQVLTPSAYGGMTNTIWDVHIYGYQVDYSSDMGTLNANLDAMIAAAQRITGADGVMPAMIAEYGNSTNGDSIDSNGTESVAAVINAGSKIGSAAWAWMPGGSADHLRNGDGSLTSPYGQQVALYIGTSTQPCSADIQAANAANLVNQITQQVMAQ